MSPPHLHSLVPPEEKSSLPPTPNPGVDVLASLLRDMSTVDPGKAGASPRGASSQHKAPEAPALSGWYTEKHKSDQMEKEPYAPQLLIVQPAVSATLPALDTNQRKGQTSTTPTQAQEAVASNQQNKAQGGEKPDNAAAPAADSALPFQTRKGGF
ncbi:hypothetical protein KC333_g5516 [Hortaea werneckii]|nr:hypothetical protein KC333_g5516 [Hortaea werneckii]KAI7318720.1 hypothetical protein KC326_g3458 [Hortaea werneckii]